MRATRPRRGVPSTSISGASCGGREECCRPGWFLASSNAASAGLDTLQIPEVVGGSASALRSSFPARHYGSLTPQVGRSIRHTACKWDSGWLNWTTREEAKKRDWPQSHVRRVGGRQGEAGLQREPFSPTAVMVGQRRPGFLFGG